MSALDGRIRTIARAEAEAVLTGEAPAEAQGVGSEVAELRSQVEALTARLDAMETAAAPAAAPAAKRASRKAQESSE